MGVRQGCQNQSFTWGASSRKIRHCTSTGKQIFKNILLIRREFITIARYFLVLINWQAAIVATSMRITLFCVEFFEQVILQSLDLCDNLRCWLYHMVKCIQYACRSKKMAFKYTIRFWLTINGIRKMIETSYTINTTSSKVKTGKFPAFSWLRIFPGKPPFKAITNCLDIDFS